MSARISARSLFRHGSTPLLVAGALLCAALLLARQHLFAALSALIVVAAAGALRRVQDQFRDQFRDQLRDQCRVRFRDPLRNQCRPQLRAEAWALADAQSSASGQPAPSGPSVQPCWSTARPTKRVLDRPGLDAALDAGPDAVPEGQGHRESERNPAQSAALILLAVDAIDHLREQGGALAGEVAMLTLAGALSRSLPRQDDLLARFNPSTFAVYLPSTDLAGCLRVAARLRWAIVRLGIANAGTASGSLTVSTGVAVRYSASGGAAALIAAAESALTAAQQAGHDRLEYRELDRQAGQDSEAARAARPASQIAGRIAAFSTGRPNLRSWAEQSRSRESQPRATLFGEFQPGRAWASRSWASRSWVQEPAQALHSPQSRPLA